MPRLAVGADYRCRRKGVVGIVVVMEGESELLEIIHRGRAPRCSPGPLERACLARAGFRLGGREEIGEAADRLRRSLGEGLPVEPSGHGAEEDGVGRADDLRGSRPEGGDGHAAVEDLVDVNPDEGVEGPPVHRGQQDPAGALEEPRANAWLLLDPQLPLRRIDGNDPVRWLGAEKRIAHDDALFGRRSAGERHSEQETVSDGERYTHGKSPGWTSE